MDTKNREHLKELLENLVGADQAQAFAEDIRRGLAILSTNPAPKPGASLIAAIKAQVSTSVVERKLRSQRRAVYAKIAVAAVLMMAAAVALVTFQRRDSMWPTPANLAARTIIWDAEGFADADLAVINAELEQIEREAVALRLGEYNGDVYSELSELEMELIEMSEDFWKG